MNVCLKWSWQIKCICVILERFLFLNMFPPIKVIEKRSRKCNFDIWVTDVNKICTGEEKNKMWFRLTTNLPTDNKVICNLMSPFLIDENFTKPTKCELKNKKLKSKKAFSGFSDKSARIRTPSLITDSCQLQTLLRRSFKWCQEQVKHLGQGLMG